MGPVEIGHVLYALALVVDFGHGAHGRLAVYRHRGVAVVRAENAVISRNIEYCTYRILVVNKPVRAEFDIVVVEELSEH